MVPEIGSLNEWLAAAGCDSPKPTEHRIMEAPPDSAPELGPVEFKQQNSSELSLRLLCSPANIFGLYRKYKHIPSFVPDPSAEFAAVYQPTAVNQVVQQTCGIASIIQPYVHLTAWLWDFEFCCNGNSRSLSTHDDLQDTMSRDDFDTKLLRRALINFDAIRKSVMSGNGIASWLQSSEGW
jgi:hypothetical protein